MSPIEILACGVVGVPVAVYVVVRFGAAAFFRSKQFYDQQRNEHGTSPRKQ